MNPLWEVQIDLMEKFKAVCKKHGLKYYAAYGTLLGAVRHKGFIPWDDDIDLFMMWPDYKKMLELSSIEFSYPYFFQCHLTEKNAMPSAARLRRSDTTGFTVWEYNNVGSEYDKGVFIDIYPLFNVPDSQALKKKLKDDVIFYYESIHGYDAVNQKRNGLRVNKKYEKYIPTYEAYCEMCGGEDKVDIVQMKELYYEACAMVKTKTDMIGATSNLCLHVNNMWKAEWFEEQLVVPFENTEICIPKEYDKVLEVMYGDWRTPVRGGAEHEFAAVDLGIPWRQFDMSLVKIPNT